MSETTNNTNKTSVFSFLYRNRLIVKKNDVTILNLSILFSVISLLCAPWLVVGGFIASLALGYRYSFVRNSDDFNGNWSAVVKDAAGNVKSVVDTVTGNDAANTDAQTSDQPQQNNDWNQQ